MDDTNQMPITEVWPGAVPIETASAILNCFTLDEFFQSALDKYYLMHWTGHYFASTISSNGTIIHQDVEYIIICPSGKELRRLCYLPQVRLSFRKPKPGRGLYPVVLVQELARV